jgi:hypothetical protein
MLGQMARSAPRPPFGPPEVPVAWPHFASVFQRSRKSATIHASDASVLVPTPD